MGAAALIALSAAALLQAAALPDESAGPPAPAMPRHAHAQLRERPPVGPQAVNVVPAGRAAVRVPILMYHYIRVNPDPNDHLGFDLSVTPDDFARQMDWLAANGYHPIDFDDLRGYLLGRAGLPDRPVVLTFDDGYRDLYTTAFPILRAHRFKAVSYVVAGFVNSPVSVTAEQVLEMDANGIQIGAHTVSHADLTRLSGADLWHEVYDSKVALEGLLGHAVLDFCYPSGRVNDTVVRAVQAAGFQTATTTQPGVLHSAADRFLWTRVRVSGGEPLERLVADLGAPEPALVEAVPPPPPVPLHGPARMPVTLPLRAPREAQVAGSPASEGAFP
ncbi:MAG TPA: polysaccharide deacetylase family protein [Candidatus Dormibacteraeota bacterium]|nr:polysaccharide deacetylase family protein [Candidatus Dormibacteraeota bacterium]